MDFLELFSEPGACYVVLEARYAVGVGPHGHAVLVIPQSSRLKSRTLSQYRKIDNIEIL